MSNWGRIIAGIKGNLLGMLKKTRSELEQERNSEVTEKELGESELRLLRELD